MIVERVGIPAVLEQLAEECTELAHASLKYSRALRGENPTPKSIEECHEAIVEEVADVFIVVEQLMGHIRLQDVDQIMNRKLERWKERIGNGSD